LTDNKLNDDAEIVEKFFGELISCISKPKLSAYKALFDSPKPHVPLTAHIFLVSLSSSFYTPLHFMELTLRNKINDAMIQIYSTRKMKSRINKFCPTGSNPENWYSWMPVTKKSKEGIRIAIRRAKKHASKNNKPLTPNDVISEVTLGTWISILRERDNNKDVFFFWDKAVNLIFPRRFHMKKDGILYELDEAHYIRNRLFHHEPIWKSTDVNSYRDAIKKLHTRLFVIFDIIAWMSESMWFMMKRFVPLQPFNDLYNQGMEKFEEMNLFEGD
jgi:hypothetical protein